MTGEKKNMKKKINDEEKPKKAHLDLDATSMLYKECVYSSSTSIILTL